MTLANQTTLHFIGIAYERHDRIDQLILLIAKILKWPHQTRSLYKACIEGIFKKNTTPLPKPSWNYSQRATTYG